MSVGPGIPPTMLAELLRYKVRGRASACERAPRGLSSGIWHTPLLYRGHLHASPARVEASGERYAGSAADLLDLQPGSMDFRIFNGAVGISVSLVVQCRNSHLSSGSCLKKREGLTAPILEPRLVSQASGRHYEMIL